MAPLTRILLIAGLSALTMSCSRKEEPKPPALERAQEKLKDSMEKVETKLAEGTVEAKKLLAAAKERWDDLRPKAERAVASIEERVEKLMQDSEALKRLPPEALARVRARLDALRAKLAEAKADHERGDTDLAVEKIDDVQQESAAMEELLVERPDPPASASPGR